MDSPKHRFLHQPHAKEIADWLAHPDFLKACEVALLQFIQNQGGAASIEEASRNQFKLEGARSYMVELLTLCTVPKPLAKTIKDNLEP